MSAPQLRKLVFWTLLALLAGGSCSVFSSLEMNFWLKTLGLLTFQQVGAIIIYLTCFGFTDRGQLEK
jgi:hypothetical protein